MPLTRRDLLQQLSLVTATCALGMPRLATGATGHEKDWEWLVGNWDVWHERLRDRLVGSTTWDKFGGKCNSWPTLGGLGNIDDCLLYLPSGTYRAFAPRAFDPATGKWSIWWLDGRSASKLDPPVMGGFHAQEGEFFGDDAHKGTPVEVRFRWHETGSKRPHWDQSFSTDGGKSWEINWRNYFTRTSPTPAPLAFDEPAPEAAEDWKFLAGEWRVHNRRLNKTGAWEEFSSTLNNRPVMGGLGNVGDNVFDVATGAYRGVSMRAFDTEQRVWRSWWLDGRTPATISSSVSGRFEKGIGTLIGEDSIDGRKVQVRSRWSNITVKTARWEQATSTDGKRWETNWSADLERSV
ncbi:MAG: hypothetical protein H7Y89_02895 [Steroidobacteraceae bacterium]|nr:hypothetical protein [Steroidobacteraceae bacterium]